MSTAGASGFAALRHGPDQKRLTQEVRLVCQIPGQKRLVRTSTLGERGGFPFRLIRLEATALNDGTISSQEERNGGSSTEARGGRVSRNRSAERPAAGSRQGE